MTQSGCRILNVGDTQPNRAAKSRTLQRAGFLVREAGTGREALALAQEFLPDLVLLDVKLPDMSSNEVSRELKATLASTLVLQVSASFVETSDRVRDVEDGADSYLTEPIESEELIATICVLLRMRQAEEAARLAEQRWTATFESLSDGVCILDQNGRVKQCNSALGVLMRRAVSELQGRAAHEIWPQLQVQDLVARGPTAAEFEQDRRWFRLTADPIIERHAVVGAVCVLSDVTLRHQHEQALLQINETLEERVANRTRELARINEQLIHEIRDREDAEAALRQSQKMEAVGQLTGGIAHDFNNLLTVVLGNLDMLHKHSGGDARLGRYIARARSAVESAAALTQRLLAFSRQQPLLPQRVDLNQLVRETSEMLRRTVGESIHIELDLASDLWPAWCELNQMESALLNVAINARDAMPGGGVLSIRTGNVRVGAGEAGGGSRPQVGDYVMVSVSDTGAGMSIDVMEKAFDPFFTTKPIGQGTGLGLSMLYGFARQSGGHASLHSVEGVGTTVNIYMPRDLHEHAEPERDTETMAGVGEARAGGETVLVVEDDLAVREVVLEVLREQGYVPLQAEDAPSAIRILESEVPIDLLVTDVGLPGINGRQLADAATDRRPGLRVLFLTGYAQDTVMHQHAWEGEMPVLTKPFSMETLAATIRATLAQ